MPQLAKSKYGGLNSAANLNFMGQRAATAFVKSNPKLLRYEDLIHRLKKMLHSQKKSLRMVKTMYAAEIDSKNMLEKILRQCVDDVKNEIAIKRSENKTSSYAVYK